MNFIKETNETLHELYEYAKEQRDTEKEFTVDKVKFTCQTWILAQMKNFANIVSNLTQNQR